MLKMRTMKVVYTSTTVDDRRTSYSTTATVLSISSVSTARRWSSALGEERFAFLRTYSTPLLYVRYSSISRYSQFFMILSTAARPLQYVQ